MIKNESLRINEKKWLEVMLSKKFLCRDEVVTQINCAEIYREYTNFYISLKFKVKNDLLNQIQTNVRVPIEMRVYKNNKVPMQFFLHIIQGYIYELEIFNADSSKIDSNVTLEDAKIEIIINSELKC